MKIRKAVFPVAGLGTRFLPATKAIPKEMLPIVDRPMIDYVLQEAIEAGIEHCILVAGRNSRIIEDHLDRNVELEETLRRRHKFAELRLVDTSRLGAGVASFTRQQAPLGVGHAVWCARAAIGQEPFAVLLPDVLFMNKPGCLEQMLRAYETLNAAVNLVAIEEVPLENVHMYGIVEVAQKKSDILFEIKGLVEKPRSTRAPSNLSVAGRYILQPEIVTTLQSQATGEGGEIRLTDAIAEMTKTQKLYGLKFGGRSFDCGSKAGFLAANLAYAMEREDLRDGLIAEFGKYSKS